MAGYTQDYIGPYEIRGKLGEGAMAVVWRGYDPNLEREVAIKEPKFSSSDSPERIAELGARFVKEGKTAARLDHGNIVTIYAADVYNGRPAIVMELVEGRTLFDVLGYGALSPDVALDIADQLLDAVACAHDHGIVHRDIKPDNIFIDASGTVKLADFGIAHIEDGSATHATMAGMVLGAPGYMSPEQAVGDPVDHRSDIFSIGVVIYEMLTGENPFRRGDSANATTILYRTVHEPVPELPDYACAGLPIDLRPAVASALAKNPDDRPQTAWDFKAQLHGAPVSIPPVEPGPIPGNKPSGSSTNYLPFIIIGAVGVAIVALLVIFSGGFTSGGGGGSSSGSGAVTPVVETQQTESAAAHLGVTDDGYVAVYKGDVGSSAELVRKTGFKLSSIEKFDSAEAQKLKDGLVVASVDEAEDRVAGYKKSLEEQGVVEDTTVTPSSEPKKTTETPAPATTPAPSTPATDNVQISVEGADGTVRNETIRRQGSTQRVCPDSNDRRLSTEEVAALSDAERCVAWNEIIAAETGYSFRNSGLAAYFNGSCGSWYRATGGSGGTDELSDAGRANVELLKSYTSGWWKDLASH